MRITKLNNKKMFEPFICRLKEQECICIVFQIAEKKVNEKDNRYV